MPKKSKCGSTFGRNTKNAKALAKKRENTDFAEADRIRSKENMAKIRQDSRVREENRLYMDERRNDNRSNRFRMHELEKQREAYHERNVQNEKIAETIRNNQAESCAIHHSRRESYRTPTNSQYWTNNYLMEAGREFYKSLDAGNTTRCVVCQESYPFIKTGPRNQKCQRCNSNQIFRKKNNLTPEMAPNCLRDLTPVEKSAISQICPVLQVYKKGNSTGSRGHCVSVMQDVKAFVTKLPPLPRDLPYLYLRPPTERVTDTYFSVRRDNIVKALEWLQINNPYYKDIVISEENAREYPENGILQTIRQLDPGTYNIPEERPSACNEDSAVDPASTADLPPRHRDAWDMFREALQHNKEQGDQIIMDQGEGTEGMEDEDVRPDQPDDVAEEERIFDEALDPNDCFHPNQPLEGVEHMAWPKRGRLVSEFETGFFARSFPDLFPMNILHESEGDVELHIIETGDVTEPREGKNPSIAEYFKHLLRYSRAFAAHHCFTFVAVNILRRHMCLTRGNVFARHCAKDLTLGQLKEAMQNGDEQVFRKLLHFSSPIPATMQYMRHQSDLCLSYLKWVRMSSQDRDTFNFFQTFSAADLHWHDLHLILPGHEEYLYRTPVDNVEAFPVNERHQYIDKREDHRLRSKAIRDNQDLVDWYFHHRIESILQYVLKQIGVTEYIVRYESQHRGTMHAHLLLSVQNGPSHDDLENAFSFEEISTSSSAPVASTSTEQAPSQAMRIFVDRATQSLQSNTKNAEIMEAKKKIINFTNMLGVSAVHPQREVRHWPGPEGLANQAPPLNVLREEYMNINIEGDFETHYEMLLNRTMLHKCREGYCLCLKHTKFGKKICRFGFEADYLGFDPVYEDEGKSLKSFKRNKQCPEGAEIRDGDLFLLRNHKRMVAHIPELLCIWQANIEGRPVRSYRQVQRYLLKYMMKNEPNSAPFNAIMRATVEDANQEDPVRKIFQRILMKTIGTHDLSKQQCMHILNGLPFVSFPRKIVYVNVMGTRRVQENLLEKDGDARRQIKVAKNIADQYWGRDSDPRYLEACRKWEEGRLQLEQHPNQVSLYEFASYFRLDWKKSKDLKIPHITPNFNKIPKRLGKQERYQMFLTSLLLVHMPGAKLIDVESLCIAELEGECRRFCYSPKCPKLVREEFEESQEDCHNDNNRLEPMDNLRTTQDELIIDHDITDEVYEQPESWERLLHPILQLEDELLGDGTYDDAEFLKQAQGINWNLDAEYLGITTADEFRKMGTWLDEQMQVFQIQRNLAAVGGLPEKLNEKQFITFAILRDFILKADTKGIENVPQLLLNISGAAGTGKSYWLNTIRQFAKTTVKRYGNEFILSAAPTGAAAFLIGGSTLHSLLYLPTNLTQNQKMPPLDSIKLKALQERFKSVGLLIIDEKSMIGQKAFYMLNERLKEARPHSQDQVFGGVSVVLLGDWKQLPPVGDFALYHNSGGKWVAGFNLYRHFKDVIFFNKIQRQTGDDQKQFRDQLERLGNGEFTKSDWMKWQARSLDKLCPAERLDFEQKATKACAYKKDMESYNAQRVKGIGKPIAPISAENDCSEAKGVKGDNESGLPSHLILCKGAKIRLTTNLWTAAGLVNGAIGHVYAIIYDKEEKPPQIPRAVIVIFESYIGPSYLSSIAKAVPILPVRRTWLSNGRNCNKRQPSQYTNYRAPLKR